MALRGQCGLRCTLLEPAVLTGHFPCVPFSHEVSDQVSVYVWSSHAAWVKSTHRNLENTSLHCLDSQGINILWHGCGVLDTNEVNMLLREASHCFGSHLRGCPISWRGLLKTSDASILPFIASLTKIDCNMAVEDIKTHRLMQEDTDTYSSGFEPCIIGILIMLVILMFTKMIPQA